MPQDRMIDWRHNSSGQSVAVKISAVKETLPKWNRLEYELNVLYTSQKDSKLRMIFAW